MTQSPSSIGDRPPNLMLLGSPRTTGEPENLTQLDRVEPSVPSKEARWEPPAACDLLACECLYWYLAEIQITLVL